MKTSISLLLICICFLLPRFSQAQGYLAVDDSVCIMQGQPFTYNVTTNDHVPQGVIPLIQPLGQTSCFFLNELGQLFLNPDAQDCCGVHQLKYRLLGCQGGPDICAADVTITVKCPKPNCFLVNLEDIGGSSDPTGGQGSTCAYACENSSATYYVGYNPANTYIWSVFGGTYMLAGNPAEINVVWGAAGTGSITLTIIDSNGNSKTKQICVQILTAPVASFQVADSSVCRSAPVSFINNSTGGSSFLWVFGDGNSSTMFSPTHQYNAPGTYTACLYVTKNNYDDHGNPLCCCTDSTCLEIVVDSLAGPNIYCISTLCAFDSTKYWTDATNCSSYVWTVLNADGSPAIFTGQGTDTIHVQWGAGPNGTVTLDVMGCDSAYCDDPVTVIVPIISDTVALVGPVQVCENETATYTAPKWISAYYNWLVTGGVIVSGQGTNTVTIQWGLAPGPGTIHLDYGSGFLGGLPGQDPADCQGSADLIVAIKPAFQIFGPTGVVCLNSTTSFSATSSPWSNYNWSIAPAVPFTGQGSNFITVNWNTSPGTYVVTAVPTNVNVYCNDTVSTIVQVVKVAPPDSITGALQICPGSTYTYFGHTSQSGVGFNWTITGGTPATGTGNAITVTWNASGPYILTLQQYQLSAPFCTSDPIQLTVLPKKLNGPLLISGPPACINTTANYSASPGQHPDATYLWKVLPANVGSVFAGQGTANIQVQWNNIATTATLMLTVKLCDDSLVTMLPVVVHAPMIPTITQIGTLCPGVSAQLDAGAGFASYMWSTFATTQMITISSGGTYVVTTTDANNCQGIDSYQAVSLPGPVADISTGDPTGLCINPPNNNTVTIYAQTNPNYNFAWYCNNILQALPPTQAFLVHTNTNVVASFAYKVVVTDISTGCTNMSNVIVVHQDSCINGGAGTCKPQSYTINITSMNQTPNCDQVNFTVTTTGPVTLTGWNFGDPNDNTNAGTLANAIHTYTKAGCFLATVSALVTEALPGTGSCTVYETESVCVPIVADFDYTVNCLKVNFTDISTSLPMQGATGWSWAFGDMGTSTSQNPMHTYATGGTYNVTLTVTNANGCQSTVTLPVVVAGPPNATITASMNPVCVGKPVQFTGTGAGVISWNWSFGDGSNNGGQNPAHTYLMQGTYTVTLIVQDAQGCADTAMITIMVNPSPMPDTIAYSPSLTFCAGGNVTLTAPGGTGYSWLWSTNATTQSIVVTTAGNYSVTVTDGNGCTYVPDSVVVVVYPAPQATIQGNPVICDSGCTTLHAPLGGGYTYVWVDNNNIPLVPAQTGATLMVCDTNLLPGYAVIVTDANGCTAISPQVVVSVAVSPSFSLTIAPDSCEGTPATITLAPVQPNVVYSWSNGGTGASITVIQAGTYVVVGTDTTSGCNASATATIHPLPDLCLVPVGCYEICNPDTICGPDGLAAYQWNLNGAPISGATNQCLIVTQSGTYSLTGTTAFGCEATSDSLMLMVIDCGCEQLSVSAEPSETDSCCWTLSYVNHYGDLFGMVISSEDADFQVNLGTIDPALQVYSAGLSSISLVSSVFGQALPSDTLPDFVTICLTNVKNFPQKIVIDWYDFDYNIACTDTLIFDCPVEPDCLYLKADSIYCDGDAVKYTITVCNPVDNDFAVGYILIQPTSPAGIIVMPSFILDTINPIKPGECRDYTLMLSGPNLEGDTFCFGLTAHDMPPAEIDTTHCCMLDTTYCVPIPDCMPCDDIGIEFANEVSSAQGDPCCISIGLYNNYQANYFDGIDICMLSPNTTMTLTNPFGSGWFTSSYAPTMFSLNVVPPLGNSIPLGVVQLPLICIHTNAAPPQLLEIKWMQGDSVVCRDTVHLSCEPPCGYILEDTITCNEDGGWTYQGLIKNTSDFTMGEADIVFTSPSGLSIYNQSIPLGSLPPGGTYPFTLVIGPPAHAGDTICFTVALHQLDDDSLHVNCCNFYDCIVLPDCALPSSECVCDEKFEQLITKGIHHSILAAPPYTAVFSPGGIMNSCDVVAWTWGHGTTVDTTYGNASVIHTFPGPGVYSVCMKVHRLDMINGIECKYEVCEKIQFLTKTHTLDDPGHEMEIYPNPTSSGMFTVALRSGWDTPGQVQVFDVYGRAVSTLVRFPAGQGQRIPIDLGSAAAGIYFVELRSDGKKWLRRVVVQ